MNLDFLDQVPSQAGLAKSVGLSEPAVSRMASKKLFPKGGTFGDWLRAYCSHLREQAAGRAGDKQVNLTARRAEESEMKTNLLRLEYEEKLGSLVVATEAEEGLRDWAGFANREFGICIENIVASIESEQGIVVDREQVAKIAGATIERVRARADALGRRLLNSGEPVEDCQNPPSPSIR